MSTLEFNYTHNNSLDYISQSTLGHLKITKQCLEKDGKRFTKSYIQKVNSFMERIFDITELEVIYCEYIDETILDIHFRTFQSISLFEKKFISLGDNTDIIYSKYLIQNTIFWLQEKYKSKNYEIHNDDLIVIYNILQRIKFYHQKQNTYVN